MILADVFIHFWVDQILSVHLLGYLCPRALRIREDLRAKNVIRIVRRVKTLVITKKLFRNSTTYSRIGEMGAIFAGRS